jgi:transaldolase/glucose-6-phosphate isomerase
MTKLHELAQVGQSVWLDYIRRSLLDSGELQSWVDRGVRGVTSNPSIFEKAIAGSADYDGQLRSLVGQGKSPRELYEAMILQDIAQAADILLPVYEATSGLDGYVSLEVDPMLAHNMEGTLAEAKRFHEVLGRPNVLFKVPATPAGMPAIEELIAARINVNITLVFSLSQYRDVAEAYIAGLERLADAGGDLTKVASVASFFVSRVDTAVDRALADAGATDAQGKAAVANAKVAYALSKELFSGERWDRLAGRGARVQRVLWASTSTKNPVYSDTKYVEELIGPDTVNTVPPHTLDMFLDHGTAVPTLGEGIAEARSNLRRLSELGIDLEEITDKLLEDGVQAFADAYQSLLTSISEKRDRLLAEWELLAVHLGEHQDAVAQALETIEKQDIVARIWSHDHTVWKPDPTEITNRLGWLDIAEKMLDNVPCLDALAEDVCAEGFTDILLLGMGGSSLAPEVFSTVFGGNGGFLNLTVLDMTDPAAVLTQAERLKLERTLFLVASKSGRTVETLSFYRRFYDWALAELGEEEAGRHFVAITDPGSQLIEIAADHGFRALFLNDPDIGGRYSALSYYGLVPAALVGVDLETLLNRALVMACNCEPSNAGCGGDNAGVLLGATLGELANAGRSKLTLILSESVAHFGDWIEQLVAESTGKEGKGILPVIGEPLGAPEVYGTDRVFVSLRLNGDESDDVPLLKLQEAGHPVVRIRLRDRYDLGGQFFLWEMAAAVAGHVMQINPFNQPDVEASKRRAREMIDRYEKEGELPQGPRSPLSGEELLSFLGQARPGDYVSLQVYVQPTPELDQALQALRTRLRDRYKLATTVGYGPRFLHSTGQLHKGDAGNGLFIQLTDDATHDVSIPDQAGSASISISFGILEEAQALGDLQALHEAGRRVIRFCLGSDVVGSVRKLTAIVG